MFDKTIQPYTQPFLKFVAKIFVKFMTPNQVSFIGFFIGLLMCVFLFCLNFIFMLS